MKQVSIIFFTLLACILGACSSDDDKGLEVADSYTPLIKEGKIDTTPLITHRFPLERIAEAYELFEQKRDGVIKVAITQ